MPYKLEIHNMYLSESTSRQQALFDERLGHIRKRPDTVGHPPNAQNHASDMPSLKAQKSLESNAVTAAVSPGNRMTNSIRPFLRQFPSTIR
jgi:hypothetical protein